MEKHVVRFANTQMRFFNNAKAIEKENFGKGCCCYEIGESISIDNLIFLQMYGNMRNGNEFELMWRK